MARDEVTVLLPTIDATQSIDVGEITKTAVTQANGIKINDAFKNKDNSLQIYIENTATSAKTATFKAGDNYPSAMLGDLTVALTASTITVVELLDIARFENRDGSIDLDFNSGFTGNVWAVAKRAGILPADQQ